MLACKGEHEGPWARPQGCEAGIRVSVVEGESLVFVEYELRGLPTASYELGKGEHPFHHPGCRKFRFVKKHNDGVPATVEVLFQ